MSLDTKLTMKEEIDSLLLKNSNKTKHEANHRVENIDITEQVEPRRNQLLYLRNDFLWYFSVMVYRNSSSINRFNETVILSLIDLDLNNCT